MQIRLMQSHALHDYIKQ